MDAESLIERAQKIKGAIPVVGTISGLQDCVFDLAELVEEIAKELERRQKSNGQTNHPINPDAVDS